MTYFGPYSDSGSYAHGAANGGGNDVWNEPRMSPAQPAQPSPEMEMNEERQLMMTASLTPHFCQLLSAPSQMFKYGSGSKSQKMFLNLTGFPALGR